MCEHGRCDSCGDSFPRKELTPVGSSLLCPECLDTATTTCAHCGERIFWDENAGNRATPLCQSCYERYYTECSRCGAMIRQSEVCYYDSDDEPLCSDCYNRTSKYRSIHDYYFKPAPIFYGEGPRYFGVELEIDGAGEDNYNARALYFFERHWAGLPIFRRHSVPMTEDDLWERPLHPPDGHRRRE